jgi:hypothetical protein
MQDNLGISLDVFYQINSSMKSDCAGLSLESNHCLSTKDFGVNGLEGGEDTSSSPTLSSPPVGRGTLTLI